MSMIAYLCNGSDPECHGSMGCLETCRHTFHRTHSLHYKNHEPSEEELNTHFRRLDTEKLFEIGVGKMAETPTKISKRCTYSISNKE